jgi:hypothetical protein
MKKSCVTMLSLFFLASGAFAEAPYPLCVIDPAAMPETWLPQTEVQKKLTYPEPWTAAEAEDASKAIQGGLNEMIAYYEKKPEAMKSVWEDTIGSVIEVTYSGSNRHDIQAQGISAARKYLEALMDPFVKRDPKTAKCDEFEDTIPFTLYANRLLDQSDPRREQILAFTNAAYEECDSLADAMGYDYPKLLSDPNSPVESVFDLVIWSLLWIEAETVPGLVMPKGAKEFSPALWKYLETYPLPDADTFDDGAEDDQFVEVAYLATHIAYIPTGNHRYPLYIEDSPNLYRFLRENFYPILEMGELDLVAEVVDTFRQYGCDDENDIQTRDGARWLLDLYHDHKESWMAYREPGETDAMVEDYDFIHKAWTGISGVRNRVIEEPVPGTYGGVVRAWLPAPQ